MQGLPLRDIHPPHAAPWWPPAPGWWIVFAVSACAIVAIAGWWLRRRHRRRTIGRLFDDAVAASDAAGPRVAAMSELLRRAARGVDSAADKLDGSAWLLFLDGRSTDAPFSQGPGRVLLDGGFRRTVADDDAATLLPLARRRYLDLMARRR